MGEPETKRPRGRPPAIDWASVELGHEPDQATADRLGVARSTVSAQRARRGIPAFADVTGRLDELEGRVARLEERAGAPPKGSAPDS